MDGLNKIKNKNFLEKYNGKYLYLVHLYECRLKKKKDEIGIYRINKNKILCAVKNKNILGFQFHPEKSSFDGLQILKDFAIYNMKLLGIVLARKNSQD